MLQTSALPLGYVAKSKWSGRRDSNSRPSPWQGDALPLSHSRKWCPEAESNHRHEDFQSSALPTELSGLVWNWCIRTKMVGLARLELATSRLSGVRSNLLSYKPLNIFFMLYDSNSQNRKSQQKHWNYRRQLDYHGELVWKIFNI